MPGAPFALGDSGGGCGECGCECAEPEPPMLIPFAEECEMGTGGGPTTGVRLARFMVEKRGPTGAPLDGDTIPFGVSECPPPGAVDPPASAG